MQKKKIYFNLEAYEKWNSSNDDFSVLIVSKKTDLKIIKEETEKLFNSYVNSELKIHPNYSLENMLKKIGLWKGEMSSNSEYRIVSGVNPTTLNYLLRFKEIEEKIDKVIVDDYHLNKF